METCGIVSLRQRGAAAAPTVIIENLLKLEIEAA